MQETGTSYAFKINNTRQFFTLIVLCVIEFLILATVFFWWLVAVWNAGNFSLVLSLLLVIILPIATFYFFRRKSTDQVVVILSSSQMEIQWPSKKVVIAFADVKSYSACRTSQEAYERESVRIRLKSGKKIRLTATSDICDIKPLEDFRKNFDILASNLKLEHKLTWDEQILLLK